MTRARLIVAEPAAAYLHRPRLVVDASVLAAIIFAEPSGPDAHAWTSGRALCAPHLLDAEMANAALNKLRRRGMPADAVLGALESFASIELQRFMTSPAEVVKLAQRYALSAYDASYVWLAASLGAPLATFDARLGEAATKHLAGGERPG
jgi:predicted nucleic acid-binding protein